MDRQDVSELHYIVHADNLVSIESEGLLCHNETDRRGIEATSVANTSVQSRRAGMTVADRPLHDYVNLYFNARNLMMYTVLSFDTIPPALHDELCILSLDASVLDMEGAIIADGNAAADLTRYHSSPEGLNHLKREHVYAKRWHDPEEHAERRVAVMSELLVPDSIPPDYIEGAYVCCETAEDAIGDATDDIPLTVNRHVFFNSGERRHD